MDLTVQQSCPSCGADISLHEDDRLIRCTFCDVQNYRIGSISPRYFLPPLSRNHIEPEEMLFIPYLRFRGSVFYVRGLEVGFKIVDTSRLAVNSSVLPVSLGLRPQAMHVQPVVSSIKGRFIHQTVATKEAFVHAALVTELFEKREKKVPIYHRSFVGETLSRIYLPCYKKDDRLIDAVDESDLGAYASFEPNCAQAKVAREAWEPRFINTNCPGCGGMLEGQVDALVLQCKNCEKLWQEEERRFVPVDWQVVGTHTSSVRYLPIWKLEVSTEGYELKSFGDLLRFTNQPVRVENVHDSKVLEIYLPAFKLRPKSFLQAATQLTLAQLKIPDGKRQRVKMGHPVTLDLKEAFQAVKAILASCTVAREKRLPLLRGMKVKLQKSVLVYLPFHVDSHDGIEHYTGAVIQSAALRYGRFL